MSIEFTIKESTALTTHSSPNFQNTHVGMEVMESGYGNVILTGGEISALSSVLLVEWRKDDNTGPSNKLLLLLLPGNELLRKPDMLR